MVIGTPGKIQDLMKHHALDVKGIKIFVLDEADVMLDKQGMMAQSLRLKGYPFIFLLSLLFHHCASSSHTPSHLNRFLPGKGRDCQILLFSATYNEEVEKFAEEFVPEPKVTIRLERKELSLEKIAQFYIECDNEPHRFNILSDLYCYLTISQSIIFVEVPCDNLPPSR